MKKPAVLLIAIVLILVGLFFLLLRHDRPIDATADELTVHCAAGLQKPVSEIAKQYEEEFGTRINLNYAGSGVLESQLKIAGGDLFIPADFSYIENTRQQGIVKEAIPLCLLRAVIVVPKGNPAGIRGLDDLKKPGVRVCVAEPSAAVGKYIRKILTESGDWLEIKPRIVVTQGTVNGVVETAATRSVDAALAWDAIAMQSSDVEIIRVPLLESKPRNAHVGVLTGAQTPAALHFARYLAAKGKGREVFAKHRFRLPEEADAWSDAPEIVLFSGSMLKPAIQESLRRFEQREGCRINTSYEGCGTLVAMMKEGGAKPSAYFSCDSSFLVDVEEMFQSGRVVASNEIVLLVPKGNPKGLKNLQSLTEANLKVGVADPVKSALGKLTETMLAKHGLSKKIAPNIIVLASKGDELVNQMQVGALDAALLYHSNARASEQIMENCEIIPLNDALSIATQPFAVSKTTPYPLLMQRLFQTLTDEQSEASFKKYGFQWKLGE